MDHKKHLFPKLTRTIIVGLVAGFASGLLGIGGGLIFVPAMVFFLDLPQHTAQGTALLVILPTALSGAMRYYLSGYLNLEYVVWVAAGAMLGVLLGSFFAHKLPPEHLRRAFGLFMILVAVKMFVG